ncbi:MAG: RagB/SusD family nutrient uptake outer membrane protein [Mangrovibacterium sp.]
MKRIKYLVIIIILTSVSCSESFLETQHPGTLTYDKFYKTESDFQVALNACYLSLKGQVQHLIAFNDLMTDNCFLNSLNSTFDTYQFDACTISSSSSTISNFWWVCYRSIALANLVITRIKDSSVPESTRKVFIAEAKFIRAYSYFNLVRVFGGVPKYETETVDLTEIYTVPRSTEAEIYEFIISDLKAAIEVDSYRSHAQLAQSKGKASEVSGKALLGKVYLQMHDYANAAATLGNLITNKPSGLELEEDLTKLYNADNPFNKEIILAVNYERVSGQSSPFTYSTLPKFSKGILPNVTSTDNGDGSNNIEPVTYNKFTDNDKRKALIGSYTVTGSAGGTYYYTKKYLDLATTQAGLSAADFIILRYADVLLMYADALNNTGKTTDAYQYIQMVRDRAGLSPLPSGYTKDQMNAALAQERQFEFILEGDRWFDLSYRGFSYLKQTLNNFFPNSAYVKTAVINDHEILFPLPYNQVKAKPDVLIQNEGY